MEEEETVEQVVLTIDDGKRAEAVQANSFSDSLKGPTATTAQVGRPAPPFAPKDIYAEACPLYLPRPQPLPRSAPVPVPPPHALME